MSASTKDRVFQCFVSIFDIDDSVDTSTLVYREYEAWTSIAHMTLIAELEAEFDAMLETDEILAMSNFDKAVETMEQYA